MSRDPKPVAAPPPIANALTIDVEDYFQVQAYATAIDRTTWDSIPRRVEANTDLILAALAAHRVTAPSSPSAGSPNATPR